MSERDLGWGIVGTGHIARLFASDMAFAEGTHVAAVVSRSRDRAETFARDYRAPAAYADLDAMVSDPDVDVVYVASPHAMHHAHCQRALEAGKAVLCEKPFAVNAREAESLVTLARHRRLFLMEGMWSRAFPAMARVNQWIAEGCIGEVKCVIAAFGFRAPADDADRRFDIALGGGALLDVGVYAISLCSMLKGSPQRVQAVSHLGSTGVDEWTGVLLGLAGGAVATLTCSTRAELPQDAFIIGERGSIRIVAPFWRPTRLELQRSAAPDDLLRESGWLRRNFVAGGRRLRARLMAHGRVGATAGDKLRSLGHRLLTVGGVSRARFPLSGWGLHYEISEVVRCLRRGLLESPLAPLDESLEIMRTLDRVRREIGLRYPQDSQR